MSRIKTDLRPAISKMTVKGTLPSISSERERFFTESVKGRSMDLAPSSTGSSSSSRRRPSEKKDNIEHLLKEIEKWRSKFTSSQRSLEESRTELKFKTDSIHSLESKIETLEGDFKRDLHVAKEKLGSHSKCKKEIDDLKEAISLKEAEFERLNSEFVTQLHAQEQKIEFILKENEEKIREQEKRNNTEKEAMLNEFEKKITDLKNDHEKQLAAKDEILKLMKKQIAEALTGSSLERQQQIEELLKELKRVSDEAETVKAALRNLKTKGDCQKCSLYETKCKELQEQLKAREISFNELMKISTKMERQIAQQDDLLALWNKVKNDNKRTSR